MGQLWGLSQSSGAWLPAWEAIFATVSHSGRFRARPSQANFPGNSPGRFCLLSYITSFDKFQLSRSLKATGHAGPRVCDCLARWLPGPWPARACCAIRNRGLDRQRVSYCALWRAGRQLWRLSQASWGLAGGLGNCVTLWALPRAAKPNQFPGKFSWQILFALLYHFF